jgi:hypothetical protein
MVAAGDCIVAERNFCTLGFLFGVARRGAFLEWPDHFFQWNAPTPRLTRKDKKDLPQAALCLKAEEGQENVEDSNALRYEPGYGWTIEEDSVVDKARRREEAREKHARVVGKGWRQLELMQRGKGFLLSDT